MILNIDTEMSYGLDQTTALLLQIEAALLPDQQIISAHIQTSRTEHFARVPAEEAIGDRIWIQAGGPFWCRYTAKVEVQREAHDLMPLDAVQPHMLPGDTVRYLMPSRFCPAADFQSFVAREFGTLWGGARVTRMRDWIAAKMQYVPGASGSHTTARDTFVHRQGVCRDYAHLMITFARASGIPARFASVYAPGVNPPDFHAVAEVYLDGAWHLVDATGMASPDTIAVIGVGTDAAEVAFLSGFGPMYLSQQSVNVTIA